MVSLCEPVTVNKGNITAEHILVNGVSLSEIYPVDVYVQGPTLPSTIAKSDFNVLNDIFAFVK